MEYQVKKQNEARSKEEHIGTLFQSIETSKCLMIRLGLSYSAYETVVLLLMQFQSTVLSMINLTLLSKTSDTNKEKNISDYNDLERQLNIIVEDVRGLLKGIKELEFVEVEPWTDMSIQ